MNKKFVIAGLTAGLVAGSGAGLILSQSGFAGASSAPAIVATVGDSTGTADQGRPDPSTRIAEVLQPLVENGTLTQAQLDTVVQTLADNMPQGGRGGRGDHGGRGGRGDHGGRGQRGEHLEAAATALGVTADELRTELQAGKTIAQVAADQGVDVQDVIDALVAEVKEHLDEEVASGEHTQEEADAKLAEATTRITDRVNNGKPDMPPADQPPVTTAG
jgi:gas vesicle protein